MPTPLGHALGGFIAGWLVAGGRLQEALPGQVWWPSSPLRRVLQPVWRASFRLRATRDGVTSPKPWRWRAVPDKRSSPSADQQGGRLRRWLGVPGRRSALLALLVFALVGMSPDLDLLVGRHSQVTHSLGATAAVFAFALLLLRRHRDGLILALAVAAAYASHPLLDWLGEDATPPYGITALWPFSGDYHSSGADLFRGIARYYWRPGALQQNVLAVAREVLILGPLALAAWWVRRPTTPSQNPRRDSGRGRQPLQSRPAQDA